MKRFELFNSLISKGVKRMQHDEQKVIAAIKGEKRALEQLLKLEKDKLYRMAYTYVRNEEDAIDIFQQTMLQAVESIHRLREPSYFSTWLTKICINNALTVLRKKQKIIVLENVAEYLVGKEQSENLAQKLDVANALGKLPEKYQTVLLLRFYQDLSIKQIMDVLDCPEGTVKTNIRRGLAQLKKSLKGVYKDERQRDFN